MDVSWVFNQYLTPKMVIWKEREHDLDDTQVKNDPMIMRALRECRLLKYFRVLGMRPYVWLLEYLI